MYTSYVYVHKYNRSHDAAAMHQKQHMLMVETVASSLTCQWVRMSFTRSGAKDLATRAAAGKTSQPCSSQNAKQHQENGSYH